MILKSNFLNRFFYGLINVSSEIREFYTSLMQHLPAVVFVLES